MELINAKRVQRSGLEISVSTTLQPETKPRKRSSQRRLSEPEKRSIIAAVAQGVTQQQVAKDFNCHPNTVNTLVKSVKEVENSPLSTGWRSKLTETLPQLSVDAIEKSLKDDQDVHKAASTALSHLKGIGVLAQDGGSNVNVFIQQVANLPADWQSEYFTVEPDTPTSSVCVPESGATGE